MSWGWLFFKATTDPIGVDYRPLTPAWFLAHVGRLPTIVLLVGREMLDLPHWSLFWVALVSASDRASSSSWPPWTHLGLINGHRFCRILSAGNRSRA